MALTPTQVVDARRQMIAAAFPNGAPCTVTKTQVDTAMAAVVAWLEANSASAVTAMNGTVLQGVSATVQAEALAIAAVVRYG